VTALPAPVAGLQVTPLGSQRAVLALPATHPHADAPSVDLAQLAPERVIVLPRDANPAFHNAVVSIARDAGLSPSFVETPEASVEQALLAVAAGGGVALLPESAAERYAVPGVRFVPVASVEPAFEAAVLTARDNQSLACAAFLHSLTRATAAARAAGARPAALRRVA
jgi:DNA-binding transcriptional LysR family regulator